MQVVFNKAEEDLIGGCIRNERLAQKRLYERYYGKLMGVCMRYAPDKDQATEILNRGFLKIFTTIGAFGKRGSNVEGWMYRIMVNSAIDYLRSEIRHQHDEIEKSVYAEDTADVISAMNAEQILEMVGRLSPAYRAVFNLYVIEGYNHAEIGEKLGISEGTLKVKLSQSKDAVTGNDN